MNYKQLLKNYPVENKENFNKIKTFQNYIRLYKFMLFLLISSTAIFLLSIIVKDEKNIIIFNGIFCFGSILLSIFFYSNSISDFSKISNKHRFIQYATVTLCFFWSVSLAGLHANRLILFSNYLLVIVCAGTLLYIRWQVLLTIFIASFTYLLTITRFLNTIEENKIVTIMSIIFFMLASLFISRIIYSQNLSNYEKSELLKKHNISLENDLTEKTKAIQQASEKQSRDIVIALTNILDYYDTYTIGHSKEVAVIAQGFAIFLKLSIHQVTNIYWSSMVHDIGKVRIPRSILNKAGKLTDEEFNEIKLHPVHGYNVLKDASSLKEIAEIMKYHHEKWDGSGYPDNLKGDEIKIESQVLSIADAFEAMTSKRAYHKARSKRKALAEIKRCSGTQFSEYMVENFIKYINS